MRTAGWISFAVMLGGALCVWPEAAWTASDAREIASRVERARGLAHYITGVSHDLQGRLPEAVREYSSVLRLQPGTSAAHLRLGSSLARMGEYDEALKELAAASRLDPENLEAHYLSAVIAMGLRNFDMAAREYEFILQKLDLKGPRSADVRMDLGQLYFSQGNRPKAFEQFERAVVEAPENAELLYQVGTYFLEAERRPRATEIFRMCVQADGEHDGCLNALGYIYAEDGVNLDESVELITRAIAVDPRNPAYMDSLGWAYYQKGQYQLALAQLTQAAALIEDPTVFDHLADVHFKLGHSDEAVRFWKRSLDLDAAQPQVRSKLEKISPPRAALPADSAVK